MAEYKSLDNPCFNCPDRHVGCHVTCERRAVWMEHHLAEKKKEVQARRREAMLNEHVIAEKEKARRRHDYRRSRKR